MLISQKDLLISVAAFVLIAITTIVIESLLKQRKISVLTGRKLLHFIAIINCAWVIQATNFRTILGYLFIAFSGILLVIIQRKILFVQTTKSYGIALFPLAFGLLLLLPFLSILQITFAVTVLGISDAGAGYIGEKYAVQKIQFLSETKSWMGFITFFLLTFLLALALFPLNAYSFIFSFLIAIVPALAELFSHKGSDNFTVPIATAIWLFTIQQLNVATILPLFFSALILLVAAYMAFIKKWLTVGGASAALLIGLGIAAWGCMLDFLCPIFFFLSGSFLSKLNRDAGEKHGRNANQVFANGIIAFICLAVFFVSKNIIFHYCFIASFSISMADTVSSEIGKYYKGRTINIVGLKPMPVGISGGISWQGTLGGLAAALLLGFLAAIIYNWSLTIIGIISLVGFTGMLIDSFLGSTIQALFQLKDNSYSELPVPESKLIKGFSWCNNDVVNLLANAITIAIFALFLIITSYQNGQ